MCNPRPLFATLNVNPDSDDDRDGIGAFGEYAFGLLPSTPDSVPLTSRFAPTGEMEVQCPLPDACPPPLVAASDVLYRVEISTDLTGWSEVSRLNPGATAPTGNATLSAATAGFRTLTVTLPAPVIRQFVRIVAEWRPA